MWVSITVNWRKEGMEVREKLPHAPLFPCITVVLYFGTERWRGPRTLRECFHELPPELISLIPDYRIRIVEVAFLTPEELGRLKSDFRFIADYLCQTRTTNRYLPEDGEIRHVDETLKLMSAITEDDSFENAINLFLREGRRSASMCEVVQSFRDEGYEKARREFEPIMQSFRDEGYEKARKEFEPILADRERTLADRERRIRELEETVRALKAGKA